MLLHATLLLLHLLSAALWIGGMAVMHLAVRPAAVQTLDPPLRLPFMAAALGRFFDLVSAAIILLLGSGLLLLWQRGGFGAAHWSVHAMFALGLLMIAVYGHIRFVHYPRLQQAVAQRTWPQAAAQLNAIRVRVAFNLGVGTLVFALAIVARVW